MWNGNGRVTDWMARRMMAWLGRRGYLVEVNVKVPRDA
jgi:hypothetical protein